MYANLPSRARGLILVRASISFKTECMQEVKALARLGECTGWPEPLLLASTINTKILYAGPIFFTEAIRVDIH